MGQFSDEIVAVFGRTAAAQGGVISGDNPTAYNASNPIRLWIIQVVIIISVAQILSLGLSRIRQPRVIAEVIGGIVLGPSVMGRIPNFKATIFPDNSMPILTLTATAGLLLFLFLVGLEVDARFLKRNAAASTSVSIGGLAIPLGLGAALGVGVYKEFTDPKINFGDFILFTAVAIGITSLTVMTRILTELKLLDTEVGLVVLSAAIGNDIVAWVLLALTIALVNASTKLTALWVLLAATGYAIFLLYPGRWTVRWLAKRTGSLETGTPTPFMMTVVLLLVLVSSFFTDIIGVHAIFGGLLAGFIIPHDNGFAISIIEKLEDLVYILFIPVYFTLSGLRTNVGLLDTATIWGYIILLCFVAFFSKFVPCAGAAHYHGFNWRESGAIGSLMSCKGLTELIVLNIGLQAGILDSRTFSMFVVHALVVSLMTTPLVIAFYPPKNRVHLSREKPTGDETVTMAQSKESASEDEIKTKFAVVLEKFESLPPLMILSQLLFTPSSRYSSLSSIDEKGVTKSSWTSPITVEVLRLIELTNRTSALLKSQEAETLIYNDPLVSIYRSFGRLNHVLVSASLSVVNKAEFANAVATHVSSTRSQMVIVPWARGPTHVLEEQAEDQSVGIHNPFDDIIHKTIQDDQTSSAIYSEYICNVFQTSSVDVALFVDRGPANTSVGIAAKQHLFLPFFGGPDDRAALRLIIQICDANKDVRATVIRIVRTSTKEDEKEGNNTAGRLAPTPHHTIDITYDEHSNTEMRLGSNTADILIWNRFSSSPTAKANISFTTENTNHPLQTVVKLAKAEVSKATSSAGQTVIVFAGRSRRMPVESLSDELKVLIANTSPAISSKVPRSLGDVGAALVAAGVGASVLVVQTPTSSTA